MSRSVKKGPFVDPKLLKKVEKMNQGGKREPIRTYSRRCTIIPEFVGHKFLVHNGRAFIECQVTEDKVGHKLGEFSPTRTFRGHSTKKSDSAES